MKISELLEAIDPKKSNLPSAPSLNAVSPSLNDTEDNSDDQHEDAEHMEFVDQVKQLSVNLGNDLYTLTAFDYRGTLSMRRPDNEMLSKLDSIGDEWSDLYGKDLADFFRRNAGIEDGSIVQVFINGRNGHVAYMAASPHRFSLEDVEVLDTNQQAIINKVISAWKEYAPVLQDYTDGDESLEADVENDREHVLAVLKNQKQKFPKDSLPIWKQRGYASEEQYNRHKEMASRPLSPEYKAARDLKRKLRREKQRAELARRNAQS